MRLSLLVVLLESALGVLQNDGGISPGDYKSFQIDYDLPASERYQEVYEYFEVELRDMIGYWWYSFYGQETRDWFEENIG